MFESFFLLGLPYAALFSLVFGTWYRLRVEPLSVSSLSSQFLEDRWLRWGSTSFHLGILMVLVLHLIPWLVPGFWHALTSLEAFLYLIEALGFASGLLALGGVVVLLLRRFTASRLQSGTSLMDFVVLGLIALQVLAGLGVAAGYPWGSSWATGTLVPYVWSILFLRPDLTLVTDLPPLVKVHVVGAWLLLLVVPFSRLVHVFTVPLSYLVRGWRQQVLWAGVRRWPVAEPEQQRVEGRRRLVQGIAGLTGAAVLLSLGVFDTLFRFFRGPRLSPTEEIALLQKRLKRLESTARERNLQLERMQNEYVFVARLSELSDKVGKYFIDYQMRPALAFRNAEGLPLLLSAKCTHLGCTVGSQVDAQGRILCPCHISYFDIETGQPNTGSPARTPLPRLGWVLMDDLKEVVAECPPGGPMQGEPDPSRLDVLSVYIARKFEEAT